MLFFSWPGLPSELHYLLPIYPVPFIAAGLFASWLRQRWRQVAIALLVLSAVAQVWIWGQLLGFVSKTATPGGFGVPLAIQLEATSLAEAQFKQYDAREVLIAGVGQRPLAEDFPAIYDVLLHDVPHRFVDVSQTAVFPNATTVIFLDPLAGDGAALYQAAATEMERIPLRRGEGELQVLVVGETAVSPTYTFDPPHILTNWAAFAGYDAPMLHDDGTASWQVYWYTGEVSTQDFHLYNHLLNEDGERITQVDTAVFAANQWQPGDLVISHVRMPWSANGVTMRSGMYSYPGLTAVQVFDIAGNPTSDAIEIPLPMPTVTVASEGFTEPIRTPVASSLEAALINLAQVATAEEEAVVFDQIWENADQLGFSLYDSVGNKVSVSSGDWALIHRIRLRVNGQIVDYNIIDPDNIFILMRE
ncbi:MAG: hypothetical protein GY943_29460, partial [Chloroflexi bacterium]|nr:hypothetical protein [Chloroflexota bacterium]